jgi:hypothetical protein
MTDAWYIISQKWGGIADLRNFDNSNFKYCKTKEKYCILFTLSGKFGSLRATLSDSETMMW